MYQQLLKEFPCACLPLDQVRARYMSHITSTDHLMEEIRKGHIRLRYVRLTGRRSAPPFVFLRDLAVWLVAEYHRNTQPATNRVA